jgi:hypothetical protein
LKYSYMVIHVECLAPAGFAPPPDTLIDHLLGIAKAGALICVLDAVLRALPRFKANSSLPPPQAASARWFALHSLANWLVVGAGLRDAGAVARRPLCALALDAHTFFPSYATFAVHAYHLLAFTAVRPADLLHHAVFVGGLGAACFTQHWGALVNFLLLFMSGLPGALDYGLLSAVKTGHVKDRLVEKRLNAALNTWVRAPGHVAVAAVIWCCAAHGTLTVAAPVAAAVACLCLANGLYYGEQVVGSYHAARGPPPKRSK